MARRIADSIVAVIGYLLSPLSWWNDAFVNLPLAWAFASVVSLASHRLFVPAMVVGYWLTNIVGILMMTRGTAGIVSPDSRRRRRFIVSLATATAYTLLILLLYAVGVLRPLHSLLGGDRQ